MSSWNFLLSRKSSSALPPSAFSRAVEQPGELDLPEAGAGRDPGRRLLRAAASRPAPRRAGWRRRRRRAAGRPCPCRRGAARSGRCTPAPSRRRPRRRWPAASSSSPASRRRRTSRRWPAGSRDPGEEVAAFSVTRRFLYAGFGEVGEGLGRVQLLVREVAAVVVDADVAGVDRGDPVLARVELEVARGPCPGPSPRTARRRPCRARGRGGCCRRRRRRRPAGCPW